jgi:hypothetical protein
VGGRGGGIAGSSKANSKNYCFCYVCVSSTILSFPYASAGTFKRFWTNKITLSKSVHVLIFVFFSSPLPKEELCQYTPGVITTGANYYACYSKGITYTTDHVSALCVIKGDNFCDFSHTF